LISGRSGASLCSTTRERFVVKTLTKKEKGRLVRFLSAYYINTSRDSRGGESILSDFFGLVRIRCSDCTTYACVLNNLIIGNLTWDGCPSTLDTKSLVFDLKGSSVGRINHQPTKPMPFVLLKDLNIVSITPKYKKDLEILHRLIEQDTSVCTQTRQNYFPFHHMCCNGGNKFLTCGIVDCSFLPRIR
jgi:hypothetical protein